MAAVPYRHPHRLVADIGPLLDHRGFGHRRLGDQHRSVAHIGRAIAVTVTPARRRRAHRPRRGIDALAHHRARPHAVMLVTLGPAIIPLPRLVIAVAGINRNAVLGIIPAFAITIPVPVGPAVIAAAVAVDQP